MSMAHDPMILECLSRTTKNLEYTRQVLKEIDHSLQKSFNPRLAYVSAYSNQIPDKPTDHLDYLAARDVERSVAMEQNGDARNSVVLDTMPLSAKDTLPIPPKSTLPVMETNERSVQLSSLPTEVKSRLSYVDTSSNLAGEASIEPVDVSIVGTSRNDRSFVEDISVIQADPVNEVTILDENEPDDLFVVDRNNRDSKPSNHPMVDDNSWDDNSFDELIGKKQS